jgi:LPS-assembly protein
LPSGHGGFRAIETLHANLLLLNWPRRMNIHRAATLVFLTFVCLAAPSATAQEQPYLEIVPLNEEGGIEADLKARSVIITNGVVVKFKHPNPVYGQGVLVAERATVNQTTGDIIASGRVQIQRDDLVWAGENISYNFLTRKMEAVQFRAGRSPVFVSGENVSGDQSNQVYTAQNSYLTTDDVAEPATRLRAGSIKIVPGQYFEARNAVLYAGKIPVFYFPFYTQRLDGKGNRFDFVPGYRNRYGPYLLSSYNWIWNDQLDGALKVDYRQKRGVAGGADLNLHLGRWGESTFKYYHLHDLRPDIDNDGYNIPADRKRFALTYDAAPITNLTVKSQVRYQSDERILHNFLESDYRQNPQPSTFVELNQHSANFALDLYAQPRINEFFENVERLPEARLTGFRQQVWNTPLYYDSETSAGYYRRRFAVTNDIVTGANYEAARADTYHQLTLPRTFFGWLNIAPRAGGRFTYYGEASGPGATTRELNRTVFNTGAEVTFKASQTWVDQTNRLLALDGLRHIFEPSVNYVYVPNPSHAPAELPQFDTELPSLRLLPINFPDYNAIDSVDSQNVMRLGLRNRLQTKREGQLEDMLYWDIYTDWRMDPQGGQATFSDVFSDVVFRPRTWLTLESLTRYNIDDGLLRLSFHNLTLQPSEFWSWGLGHLYVRDDLSATPTALQEGNSSITSTLFLRLNENWGARAQHQYEVQEEWLQQQSYSIYRDLRNWTAALMFRVRDTRTAEGTDYAVAFTFSLKAAPRSNVGEDAVRPSRLLGY